MALFSRFFPRPRSMFRPREAILLQNRAPNYPEQRYRWKNARYSGISLYYAGSPPASPILRHLRRCSSEQREPQISLSTSLQTRAHRSTT